jgi:putative ABC transport system permease protein
VARENQGGRVFSILFGSLGSAAFLLALVGLYGVVSFSAAQRIPDMGIMRALGAEPARLMGSTLVAGLRPVVVGVMLGTLGAFLLAPTIAAGFFPTTSRDPWLFALVPLALLVTSIGAATLPAWRAARIHPVEALRRE